MGHNSNLYSFPDEKNLALVSHNKFNKENGKSSNYNNNQQATAF